MVVEGRGMVAVDIGNGDDGKWLSLDLLIFRLFAGYKHSAGVSAFVSTIFQYIMDDLEIECPRRTLMRPNNPRKQGLHCCLHSRNKTTSFTT